MLKLTYTRKNDKYQSVTVLGDAMGIRDLYWQLTHNYFAQDGTAIGNIKVTNLDGHDCTDTVTVHPYVNATQLSRLDR